jgi:hypothetical protein
MTVKQFRKKPVVIEAMRVPSGESDDAMLAWGRLVGWISATGFMDFMVTPDALEIKTLEGTMTAHPGDWIIRGVKGEFYPCKPDTFAATYEAVEP